MHCTLPLEENMWSARIDRTKKPSSVCRSNCFTSTASYNEGLSQPKPSHEGCVVMMCDVVQRCTEHKCKHGEWEKGIYHFYMLTKGLRQSNRCLSNSLLYLFNLRLLLVVPCFLLYFKYTFQNGKEQYVYIMYTRTKNCRFNSLYDPYIIIYLIFFF